MATTHIENRRLFRAAFGWLKLEKWEQDHLHECKICQGVIYVFVNQLTKPVPEDPEKPDAA